MKRKSTKSSSRADNIKKKSHGLDQWKALITSFLMQSLTLGTLESYGALYVPMMETLLKDDPTKSTKAAMVGSLTTGCLMAFSPVSSMLIDKIGPQLIALLGGVIVFLATLVSSFMTSFYFMALFYGIMFGIGCSMLFISSNVVISRYFKENSTVAYGILGLGNGLMNAIMPHVISYSVGAIQLAGTIRIICFLLSFIMFFPLYWNSYTEDEKEEFLIAYLPAKIMSNRTIIRDDTVNESIGRGSAKVTKQAIPKGTGKGQNENCFINPELIEKSEHKRRKNYLVDSEMISIPPYMYNVNNEIVNEIDANASKNIVFKKQDKIEDSKLNPLMRTKDYQYNDVSLFQKAAVSQDSSDNVENNKVIKDGTASSSKSKSHIFHFLRNCSLCDIDVFHSKPYVTLLFGMFIAMFGYQVPNVHIVKFATEISPLYNGQVLLTCLGASAAIGPFINGIIMDRFNCGISKYRLFQIFILAYGIVILTLPITSNFSVLIIVCLAIGFLDGSFSCLIGPLAIDLVGAHRAGRAIGIFYGVISPSVMIAPPLAGFIFDSFNSYKFAFYGAGLFFLVGGLLLFLSHTTSTSKDPLNLKGDFSGNVFKTIDSNPTDSKEIESASVESKLSIGMFQKQDVK